MFVITETTDGGGSGKVYIYTVNDSLVDDDPLLLQTLTVGAGAGTCVTISDDQNWIYVGDPLNNQVERFSRERIPLTAGYFTATETYEITSLGTEVNASDITTGEDYQILFPGSTDFTQIGADNNNAGTTFTATTPPTGFVTGDGICYENPTDFTALSAVENKVGILFVANVFPAGSNPLSIGACHIGWSARYMTGQIDEVRVSKGIARWTSNFTPPSAPYEPDSVAENKIGYSLYYSSPFGFI